MSDLNINFHKLRDHIIEIEKKLSEPIRADGWKNIYFMRGGGYAIGTNVHATEKAAHAGAEVAVKVMMRKGVGEWSILLQTGHVVPATHFHFHMQMPVR